MRLKNEPTSISFFTNVPASFGLMGDLARVIFDELGREISVLEVSEYGESQDIVGLEEIRDYLNQRADTVPDFDSGTAYLFYSPLIEGLWREVGADAELTLSFAFKSTGEDRMEIMISSHLFGEDNRLTGNYIRCGKHIFDLIPKSSGFSITGVPYRFFSHYAGGVQYSKDGFPDVPEEVYDAFYDELFWYGRLARPVELMTEYGLFRNIYPYNFLCEAQLFSLKTVFESTAFPRLSHEEENRLSKRLRSMGNPERPELPGTLLDLGNHSALLYVPDDKRQAVFSALSEANLTLYRFFTDYRCLFPERPTILH